MATAEAAAIRRGGKIGGSAQQMVEGRGPAASKRFGKEKVMAGGAGFSSLL